MIYFIFLKEKLWTTISFTVKNSKKKQLQKSLHDTYDYILFK